jgi:hypothetical protein
VAAEHIFIALLIRCRGCTRACLTASFRSRSRSPPRRRGFCRASASTRALSRSCRTFASSAICALADAVRIDVEDVDRAVGRRRVRLNPDDDGCRGSTADRFGGGLPDLQLVAGGDRDAIILPSRCPRSLFHALSASSAVSRPAAERVDDVAGDPGLPGEDELVLRA